MSFIGDFISEAISCILTESLPTIFKHIGASTKWLLFLGKKPYRILLKQEWNTRIGFVVVVGLITLLIQFLTS